MIAKLQFTDDMDSIACIHALRDGFNELVDDVNTLMKDRDKRIKGAAGDVLWQVYDSAEPPPVAILHMAPDGEEVLTFLLEAQAIEIVDDKVVLTDVGRQQVELVRDSVDNMAGR